MKTLVVILSLGLIISNVDAPSNNAYLKSKLIPFYIGNLNTAGEKAVRIPSGSAKHTFSRLDSNKGFYELLDKLFRDQQNGGDTVLQASAKEILSIDNKMVALMLYNDRRKISESIRNRRAGRNTAQINANWDNACFCKTDANHQWKQYASWPCADHYETSVDGYTGMIGLGNYFLSQHEVDKVANLHEKRHFYGTFIHELTHTQFDLVLEASLGNLSMYGDDGDHYVDEMIPSRNSAFNEAIANAFANFYIKSITWWTEVNKNKFQEYKFPEPVKWLNENSALIADVNAACSNASVSLKQHCLTQRLSELRVAGARGVRGSQAIKSYRIRSIPPSILLHSEMIQTSIFEEYMRLFNSKTLMVKAIQRVLKNKAASTSQDMFGMVFKEMVRSAQTYKNPSGDSNTGKYLPLAILDFYTGFKIKDKETLALVTGQSWDDKDLKIDFYFESLRPNRLIKSWEAYSQKVNGDPKNPAWNESILEEFAGFLNVVPNKRVGEFPVR